MGWQAACHVRSPVIPLCGLLEELAFIMGPPVSLVLGLQLHVHHRILLFS